MKTIKRYNVQMNAWECGYFIGTQFVIVKMERV